MTTNPKTPRQGPKCACPTEHGPCELPAGWGTNHVGAGQCRKHLGNAPAHQVHAQRTLARQAAEQFGIPVETTAEQALLDELAFTKGMVLFCRAKVAELPTDGWTYGTEKITRTRRNPSQAGPGQVVEDITVAKTKLNIWVELLLQVERHHFEVAREIARLGIEKRLVDLAEREAAMIQRILLTAFTEMGIPADDPRIPEMLPRIIRSLSA